MNTSKSLRDSLRLASIALVLASFVFAMPSAAQRPSLADLQAQHDALQAEHDTTRSVLCGMSEMAGESYRPIFCDPRCDCLIEDTPVPWTSMVSCEQISSGEVIGRLGPLSDVACTGLCFQLPAICGSDADCFTFGPCSGMSCAVTTSSCLNDGDCDQTKGYFCGSLDLCTNGVACTEGSGTCDTGVARSTGTFGFAPSGDLAPLSCSRTGETINSSDAAACIADIEVHLGADACVVCGDGNLDTLEGCDDGNLTPGDGCDATCQTE